MADYMPGSLAAIFTADKRMNEKERMRKAAERKANEARKKKESGDIGGMIGTGLGALSLLNPATASFAPAIMSGAGKAGTMVGTGEVSGGDVADLALSAVEGYAGGTDKQKDAFMSLLRYGNYGNKAFGESIKDDDKGYDDEEMRRALMRGRYG